jgi:hypothetical protein
MRYIGEQIDDEVGELSQGTQSSASDPKSVASPRFQASQSCLLRCPDSWLKAFSTQVDKFTQPFAWEEDSSCVNLKKSMLNRLENGYTVIRHRMSTGEETIAFNRGPLLPVSPASAPSADWPLFSVNGQDYLIFDRAHGIMDVSYSTAWQVGKMLATSDLGFVAALMRHRADLHRKADLERSKTILQRRAGMKTKTVSMSNLTNTMSSLKEMMAATTENRGSLDLKQRWSHTLTPPSLAITSAHEDHPEVKKSVLTGLKTASQNLASSAGSQGTEVYNELNPAASSDWAFIHDWILDKMYLGSIPAHYLVGDAAFLPPESIRFFHIDPTWIECMVDGALSVANHMADDDDNIRQLIKAEMNNYLQAQLQTNKGSHYPQVPRYGFFLRSAVVTVFPDLVVEVPYPDDTVAAGRAPILVQKHMGKDILMILLDRIPEQLDMIRMTQPAHQQRFCAGDILEEDYIEFLFRQIYREKDANGNTPAEFLHEFGGPQKLYRAHDSGHTSQLPAGTYDWDTRCLDFDKLEKFLFEPQNGLFPKDMPAEWGTGTWKLTSAITGLQLNDTMKYLEIKPPKVAGKANDPPKPYKLRTAFDNPSAPAPNRPGTTTVTPAPTTSTQPNPSVKEQTTPITIFVPPSLNFSKANLPASAISSNPSTISTVATVTKPALPQDPTNTERSFKYSIYPSIAPYPGENQKSFVYTDLEYIGDVIFSINIFPKAGKSTGLWLREIQFKIPLGDPAQRTGKGPTILGMGMCPANTSTTGSRGRMINNQRW